jgi:hypothetical protein
VANFFAVDVQLEKQGYQFPHIFHSEFGGKILMKKIVQWKYFYNPCFAVFGSHHLELEVNIVDSVIVRVDNL